MFTHMTYNIVNSINHYRPISLGKLTIISCSRFIAMAVTNVNRNLNDSKTENAETWFRVIVLLVLNASLISSPRRLDW